MCLDSHCRKACAIIKTRSAFAAQIHGRAIVDNAHSSCTRKSQTPFLRSGLWILTAIIALHPLSRSMHGSNLAGNSHSTITRLPGTRF
jgi:hypothetical protein